jgi:hypothetical protein
MANVAGGDVNRRTGRRTPPPGSISMANVAGGDVRPAETRSRRSLATPLSANQPADAPAGRSLPSNVALSDICHGDTASAELPGGRARFTRAASGRHVRRIARASSRPPARLPARRPLDCPSQSVMSERPARPDRGIYEIRWAPDGRATFQYGKSMGSGSHIIWRRIGSHAVLREP